MADYSKHTDAELIFLLNQDSEAAFTEVYRRYFDALNRHAYKMTYGDENSCDLVHDVFANMWVRRKELASNSPSALKYYLYVSIRNAVLNDRRRVQQQEKNLDDFVRYVSERSPAADAGLLSTEIQQAIEAEIAALPERMRQVFLLRRDEELSYTEIAERLDISKLTVKTQMNNAIQRLWKKFSAYFIILIISTLI